MTQVKPSYLFKTMYIELGTASTIDTNHLPLSSKGLIIGH